MPEHRGVHPCNPLSRFAPLLPSDANSTRTQVELFLSRFLSALGVGAILLTQLGMIGVTMLLQLGGLPDYARSKLSKFFWHVWALVVRPSVCVCVCVCVCVSSYNGQSG